MVNQVDRPEYIDGTSMSRTEYMKLKKLITDKPSAYDEFDREKRRDMKKWAARLMGEKADSNADLVRVFGKVTDDTQPNKYGSGIYFTRSMLREKTAPPVITMSDKPEVKQVAQTIRESAEEHHPEAVRKMEERKDEWQKKEDKRVSKMSKSERKKYEKRIKKEDKKAKKESDKANKKLRKKLNKAKKKRLKTMTKEQKKAYKKALKKKMKKAKKIFMGLPVKYQEAYVRYARKFGDEETYDRIIEFQQRRMSVYIEFAYMVSGHEYDPKNPADVDALRKTVDHELTPMEREMNRLRAEGRSYIFGKYLKPDDSYERYKDATREDWMMLREYEMDEYHAFLKKYCKKRHTKVVPSILKARKAFRKWQQKHCGHTTSSANSKTKRKDAYLYIPMCCRDVNQIKERLDELIKHKNSEAARREQMKAFMRMYGDVSKESEVIKRIDEHCGRIDESYDNMIVDLRTAMATFVDPDDYDEPDKPSEEMDLDLSSPGPLDLSTII